MARYTGPRVRVSRRIGFNVFENRKGDKALQDRPYPPGAPAVVRPAYGIVIVQR